MSDRSSFVGALIPEVVMLRVFKLLLAACFNAGWIVPFYLSIHFLIQWCQLEAAPAIYGRQGPINSFPFLGVSEAMLTVACIWLATAIVVHTACRVYGKAGDENRD